MNNNFNNGVFPNNSIFPNNQPNNTITPSIMPQIMPNNISPALDSDSEMSYIENILRQNRGKKVTVYQTFPDSNEWKDKSFNGIIEESGRDHIILSNPHSGKWYLLSMIYVDYIEFDEEIKYNTKFQG